MLKRYRKSDSDNVSFAIFFIVNKSEFKSYIMAMRCEYNIDNKIQKCYIYNTVFSAWVCTILH